MTTSLSTPSDWRLSTASGIPARLVSRSGNFTEEGGTAQEVYIIKADQLMDFVIESFPLPLTLFGTMFYPARRRMPGNESFQTTNVAWKAHVDGVPIDPFGTDPLAPDGTYADNIQVEITYGPNPSNDSSNGSDPDDPFTFLEVSCSAGGEFITFPSKGLAHWEGYGSEETINVRDRDIPIGISVPEVEWSVRWNQIPFNFFNATLAARLRSKLGKVNDAPMPLFFNAPAETILFMGWSLNQQFTWRTGSVGKSPMQLEMKFLEKNMVSPEGVQVTHNHFYRPTSTKAGTVEKIIGGKTVFDTHAGWRRIVWEDTTAYNYIYEETNLTSIFASN